MSISFIRAYYFFNRKNGVALAAFQARYLAQDGVKAAVNVGVKGVATTTMQLSINWVGSG